MPWYYARQDERFGPLSDDEMRRLAESGQLLPSDLVWRPGSDAWQPAGEVPGLLKPPPLSAKTASTPPERHAAPSPKPHQIAASSAVVSPAIILLARLGLVFILFSLLTLVLKQIDVRQSLRADVVVTVMRFLLVSFVVAFLPRVGIPPATWARTWNIAWASWAALILAINLGALVYAVLTIEWSWMLGRGLAEGIRELVEVAATWGFATALSRLGQQATARSNGQPTTTNGGPAPPGAPPQLNGPSTPAARAQRPADSPRPQRSGYVICVCGAILKRIDKRCDNCGRAPA